MRKGTFLTLENQRIAALWEERDRIFIDRPEVILPILRPCRVRVLLVADGGLDFSMGDFGLRTFVETLLATPAYYVRFEITLAHINNVPDSSLMVGDARISRNIREFKFDDTSHFTPAMYDQVWLFGIDTSYFGRGAGYPSDRLSDTELRALSEFMNGGGGLFATGDHGLLGRCLCSAIPRARSMRLWSNTSNNNDLNEVSMAGARRNDTNRLGHDINSQFNDQSDDVPQTIQPRLYSTHWGIWRYTYPHPLLCGRNGIIRVFPDHPHEGECVEPTDTARSDSFAGYNITEYPPGSGGFSRPLPEVIATSNVLSGTTSGGKDPTIAHTFGAACAYDGHRAGVGRVVTDATWHHFVNVNFIGELGLPPTDPKSMGFLATAVGQANLEEIKTYQRNIAIWISRSTQITCFRRRIFWGLVWNHRVLEAVLTRPDISIRDIDLHIVHIVGRHARDVLGYYAGQCQARRLALDLLIPIFVNELLWPLDPWVIPPRRWPIPEPDPVPWINLEIFLDAALGGALVALHEEFDPFGPDRRDRVTDESLDKALAQGAMAGIRLAAKSLMDTNKVIGTFLQHPFKQPKRTEVAPVNRKRQKPGSQSGKR